jgi:AMMECR1 domain-containing protein
MILIPALLPGVMPEAPESAIETLTKAFESAWITGEVIRAAGGLVVAS